MKIYPWKDGQGWQEHDIADRTGKTLDEVFGDFSRLELLSTITTEELENLQMDYSLEVYRDADKIAEFWLSEFIKNGVTVDGVKYSV